MKKQQILGSFFGFLTIVIAIIVAVNQPARVPRAAAPAVESKKESFYTLTQVAAHTSKDSCWTIINGNVYDLTAWIKQHPGGAQAIERLCGVDGSGAFNNQHAGGEQPAATLATFRIGTLYNE